MEPSEFRNYISDSLIWLHDQVFDKNLIPKDSSHYDYMNEGDFEGPLVQEYRHLKTSPNQEKSLDFGYFLTLKYLQTQHPYRLTEKGRRILNL